VPEDEEGGRRRRRCVLHEKDKGNDVVEHEKLYSWLGWLMGASTGRSVPVEGKGTILGIRGWKRGGTASPKHGGLTERNGGGGLQVRGACNDEACKRPSQPGKKEGKIKNCRYTHQRIRNRVFCDCETSVQTLISKRR
jgi:hypothetical protein